LAGLETATFLAGNFRAGDFFAAAFVLVSFLVADFFVAVFLDAGDFFWAAARPFKAAFLLTAFFEAAFFEAFFFATLALVERFFLEAADFAAVLADDFFFAVDFGSRPVLAFGVTAFLPLDALEARLMPDFLALAFLAVGFLAVVVVARFLALKLAYPLNWGGSTRAGWYENSDFMSN
jgi:hypothetical protein